MKLPPSLANDWASRGYYGTLSHNAKAVYQFYLGWYDANPSNLNPWPPVERARKYVAAMGGAKKVIALAKTACKRLLPRSATYKQAAEKQERKS